MSRWRLPLSAVLGVLCVLPIRFWGTSLFPPPLLPSWPVWFLVGAGAGVVTAEFSRPAHGRNWLWRSTLTGLGYMMTVLVLTGLLTFLAQLVGPPATSRTVPVVVASVSGFTVRDVSDVTLQLLGAACLTALTGAAFTLLAERDNRPA